MEKKVKHPEKVALAPSQGSEANANSEALTAAKNQTDAAQPVAEKIPSNFIVHHDAKSGYDRTARQTLVWFLTHWPGRRRRALVSYLVKTNQTFEEFNAFVLVNERSITFRKTVEEAYADALNWDLQRSSFIRIWRSNKLTHYVCAPECDIYGDYEGEMWDSAGKLKQEVMNEAICQIKAELLVEKEIVNS